MIAVAVTDKSQVVFADTVVTIHPALSLAPATPYTLTMDAYALRSVGAHLPVQVAADQMYFLTSFLEDCLVSPWSSWSPCGTSCPPGQQSRYRVVTRAARQGECSQSLEDERDCPMPASCPNAKTAEAIPSSQVIQFASPMAAAPEQPTIGITPVILTPNSAVPQVSSLVATPQMHTPVVATPQMHTPAVAAAPPGQLQIPPGMHIVSTAPAGVASAAPASMGVSAAPASMGALISKWSKETDGLSPASMYARLMQMPSPLPGGM